MSKTAEIANFSLFPFAKMKLFIKNGDILLKYSFTWVGIADADKHRNYVDRRYFKRGFYDMLTLLPPHLIFQA